MLTVAFGDSTMSRTQAQLRNNRFKEGRKDINDDARPGRPSSSTTYQSLLERLLMMLAYRPAIAK